MGWRDELMLLIRSEPMTISKIKSLTQSLMDNVIKNNNFIDYYNKSVDDAINQCKADHLLNCLYIIDAILRSASHSQSTTLLPTFSESFYNTLIYHEKKIIETLPENHIPKLLKLLDIWMKKEFFPFDLLRKWTNKLQLEMEIESFPINVTQQHRDGTSSLQKRKMELIEDSLDVLMSDLPEDSDYQPFGFGITSNQIDSGSTSNSIYSIGMLSSGSEVLKRMKSHHSPPSARGGKSLTLPTSSSFDDILKLDKVKHLSLNTSILDLPNEILSKIFSYLNVLDLMRFNFVSRFFSGFVVNCTFWRELSFNNVKNFANHHLYRIIQLYGSQMIKLDLSFCNYVDRQAINMIVTHCQSLQSLSLSKCPLVDEDLANLLKYLVNLKSLDLSQTKFTARLVQKLFKHNGLQKLNIACSHGLLNGLKPGMKLAASLESLNIDCYCSTFMGVAEASAVQEFVAKNMTLRKVKLHHMLTLEKIQPNITLRTTNLWKFVKFNDYASTKELLANISRKQLNKRYYNGSTSIFLASEEGKIEQLKLLIDKGADHTIGNYFGATPIMVSKNIETAKVWLEKKIEPTNKDEKDFLSVISVLEKYYKYLKPNINDHPSIDEVKGEELEILLTVISKSPANCEVVESSKTLTASFLKIPSLLKKILENCKHSRRSLIYSTLGNDDFFCDHIKSKLKKTQQQSVLLDLLAMN